MMKLVGLILALLVIWGVINITSTYDSRTQEVEGSIAARGDLWRVEASRVVLHLEMIIHLFSWSSSDLSSLSVIRLSFYLFICPNNICYGMVLDTKANNNVKSRN